ncbi:hypothetical protein FO519_002431 [Halicephalobus sp. NKZ332]|nr:hypothetical protein FO519_002431 [Halicephalobus sp. NKZ332]
MQIFKYYLMINSLYGLLALLTTTIFQPTFFIENFSIIILGPGRLLGNKISSALIELTLGLLIMTVGSTSMIFTFRYSLISKSLFIKNIHQKLIPSLIWTQGFPFFIAGFSIAPMPFLRIYYNEINETSVFYGNRAWKLMKFQNATVIGYDNVTNNWITIFDFLTTFPLILYIGLVVFSVLKIYKDHKSNFWKFCNPRTRKIQKIFIITLFITLFSTLVTHLIPVLIGFMGTLILKTKNSPIIVSTSIMILMTQPILNQILTMTFVTPYRKATVKWIAKIAKIKTVFEKNHATDNTVNVSPNTFNQ